MNGGKDPGAVKYVKESEANLQMALAMKEELEKHGVKVGISRIKEENDPLTEEIREANSFQPDCAVEVHNNAGGGVGFEVYTQTNQYKSESNRLAQEIWEQVKAYGHKSHGSSPFKTKLNGSGTDYFGWLRQVKAPAVLCEGFFVDNMNDVQKFDTVEEQRALGKAYAKGVLKFLGEQVHTSPSPTPNPQEKPNDQKMYRVQAGAFSNATYADNFVKKLENKGFHALVVKDDNMFIVQAGAFNDKENANRMVIQLKQAGFNAFVR